MRWFGPRKDGLYSRRYLQYSLLDIHTLAFVVVIVPIIKNIYSILWFNHRQGTYIYWCIILSAPKGEGNVACLLITLHKLGKRILMKISW